MSDEFAERLRTAVATIEGTERVEATFRIGGPVGAQSVVNIHTPTTEQTVVTAILEQAMVRCARVLTDAPTGRGNLYLYCYDAEGMRHTMSEVAEDLSVAISFSRLILRVQGA
ncbi:hypothetical protein GCM10028820_07390 [Tessaracoccus terricola]